jgi:hypothetical protein
MKTDSHRNVFRTRRAAYGIARGLGWFSIGLGLVELLAPQLISRSVGMRGREGLLRAYGLREIATGIGLLASRDPTPWVWGRVMGDAVDLATLSLRGQPLNPRLGPLGLAAGAVAGVAALDLACAQALRRQSLATERRVADYALRSGWPKPPQAMRGAAQPGEAPSARIGLAASL